MKRSLVVVLAALALVVGGVVGYAFARGDDHAAWPAHMTGGHGGPGAGPGAGSGRHSELMDHRLVRSEFDYLAQMIPHHEEAIAAAQELRRSDRAQLRTFADDIVRTQSRQVTQMKQWLAEWYPGRDTSVDYEPMMRDLGDLSGDRLDRAFLEDMIPHHMSAVMMSQQLLARGLADHDALSQLAASIRDEQHDEIFRMQRWLGQWYGERGHGRWDDGDEHGPMGPGMMW